MEEKFRLDKTAFKSTNVKDADDHVTEWRDKTPTERIEAYWFLTCHAYGVDVDIRMDKTVFSMRKRE